MPQQEDNRATVAIPAHVAWRRVEQELVLFDERDGSYHALNAVASAVWRALDAGFTLEAITNALAVRYQAPPDEITRDVAAFVDAALAKGLLERRDGEA